MSFQSFKQAFAVTPSDTTPLPKGQCKALYVGGPSGLGTTLGVSGGGKLTVRCKTPSVEYGTDLGYHVGVTAGVITFENVPVGTIIPIQATHSHETKITILSILIPVLS